jgi:hypothetical protein
MFARFQFVFFFFTLLALTFNGVEAAPTNSMDTSSWPKINGGKYLLGYKSILTALSKFFEAKFNLPF